MRNRRTTFLWGTSSLLALAIAAPHSAHASLLESERSLLADATGFSTSEFDQQLDDDFNALEGSWDATAEGLISIDAAAGFGFSSQRTTLADALMEGRGSAGASGFTAADLAIGEFSGESFLRVVFEVDSATPFRLASSLSAAAGGLGSSFASLELIGPGGAPIVSRSVAAGENDVFELVGELLPGVPYELMTVARAFADPLDLATGDGSAGFVFSLTVPEPRASALLQGALIAIALLSRRAGASRRARR